MTAARGFPPDLLNRSGTPVQMKIEDGTLRIRSPRTALAYLGEQRAPLLDSAGYIDTGDLVQLDSGRYSFCRPKGRDHQRRGSQSPP